MVRNEESIIKEKIITNNSMSNEKMNMRVSIKSSSKSVNNSNNTGDPFIFFLAENDKRVSGGSWKNAKSITMILKENT